MFRENNKKIFNFINPNSNDILIDFDSKDLRELFDLLNKYRLEYRKCLDTDCNNTFGIEIEFDQCIRRKVRESFEKENIDWEVDSDGSVPFGGEVRSEILYDKEYSWDKLYKVLDLMNPNVKLCPDTKAGGHIHIGSQILTVNETYYYNFCLLWSTFENILFRFFYGEYYTYRNGINIYAEPISAYLKHRLDNVYRKDNCFYLLCAELAEKTRYYAVNFSNTDPTNTVQNKNTIEFRLANPTLDPIVWQNNINVCLKILECAKKVDISKVFSIYKKHRIDLLSNGNKLNEYNNIYLCEAIEFCDLIFDNNLDKLYFLRQYLKSFKVTNKFSDKIKNLTNYKK